MQIYYGIGDVSEEKRSHMCDRFEKRAVREKKLNLNEVEPQQTKTNVSFPFLSSFFLNKAHSKLIYDDDIIKVVFH